MAATFAFTLSLPKASTTTADTAQRQAVESTIHLMQHVFERSRPEEILAMGQILKHSLSKAPLESEKASLLREIIGERPFSDAERLALEVSALQRAFAFRRELLSGSLSAPEVARLLGISRQSVHERAKRETLLAVLDNGSLRFPPWQFDPQGKGGVTEGLPETLHALSVPPLGKVSWLSRPNPYFEGQMPLETLRKGDRKRVVDAARAVGVS